MDNDHIKDHIKDMMFKIEKSVKDKIKEIGSTEAAKRTGLKKQYLSNAALGHIEMSYKKILELEEALKEK